VPVSKEESEDARHSGWHSTDCDVDSVFPSLLQLRNIVAQLQSSASKRDQAMMTYDLEFAVGDVVTHRKYNYRGIVIGYDQRPIMDVSGWDGVVDLPSGGDQPFYHVLPDENDCIEEFGAPRSWRYCAEENLEKIVLSNVETGNAAGQVAPEVAAVLAAAGLSLPEEAWSRFEDISHEQLQRLFERFDRNRGRYEP
jgi:hemimethylated DNA binding protein